MEKGKNFCYLSVANIITNQEAQQIIYLFWPLMVMILLVVVATCAFQKVSSSWSNMYLRNLHIAQC